MNSTARKLTLILGSNVTGAVAGLNRVGAGISSLAGRAARFAMIAGATLGFAGIGVGAVSAAKSVITLGANMEQTRLVYQTMLGSVERGNIMLQKLDQFSNSTPFSGDEVNRAAKTLMGYGVEAGSLIRILKTVGDTASGSGKDFNELAAIFGKVFAKGKMQTEELNMMVEAGIPIMKQLQRQFGVSGDAIYDMAQKGKIGADDVTRAFAVMTGKGGVFENMMEKQSKTMTGLWGAFTGQLEYAASILGEQLAPLFKVVLNYLVEWADSIAQMAANGELAAWLAKFGVAAVTVFGQFYKSAYAAFEYTKAAFLTLQTALSYGVNALQSVVADSIRMNLDLLFSGVNAAVRALNKLPGVDIELVKKPAFVDQLRDWGKQSGEQMKKDLVSLLTGSDFRNAGQDIAGNDSRVDATVDKISAAIMKWNADVQSNVVKQAKDLKKGLGGDTGGSSRRDASGTGSKHDAISVDQLTKIGMYNFTDRVLRSLDRERNNLLEAILRKIPTATGKKVLT